ncbi:bifunctional diguanylate cyclase/phosphodiesterase [Oceanimonas baumannii]|uniref:Diguanylate cyclase n=1 Tax=Oceanimonas baumannii TaxID=129578 RepID=A0A235CK16_9GAMM|nr:EAL domain-containing protein [Oceanimonas baumannii]OYD24938.1 diguanylate cyclase [Oceanimonas baumannii]TDW59703.1 PAS domain S-box-containing protein/diguanylate cyclase (GGDEF)-like protein [Oceanimonas baumannii]
MSRLSTFALHSISWLVLAGGLTFTSVAALSQKQQQDERAVQEFSTLADRLTLKLRERLSGYSLLTRSSAALFNASTMVTPADWQQFAARIKSGQSLDGIDSLGFARFISEQERHTHNATLKKNNIAGYTISPPGKRDNYGYVLYQANLNNIASLPSGLDLLTKPPLRLAMERAAETKKTIMSGKLHTATGTPSVMVLFDAVFKESGQAEQALYGWVFAIMNVNDMLSNILTGLPHPHSQWLSVKVYDGNNAAPAALVYQQGEAADTVSPLQQQRVIDLNGHQWLLVLDSLKPAAFTDNVPTLLTLTAGFALTLLLVLLLRTSLNTRIRATQLAEQLSEDIRRQETRFNQLENRFKTIASRVPGMIFEFRLQSNGHSSFPYASDGIHRLYGIHPEQVKKNAAPVFDAVHSDDMEELINSMHHSAHTLTPWRHEFRITSNDGRTRWLQGDALPQREESGATNWCGVITDMTYRKEAELALKSANNQTRHFREALDHVSSFIYMKDSRFRYIYANRAALEQFGCNSTTLIGGQDEQFFSSEVAHALRESDNRVLAGESLSEEVEIMGKDGRRIVYMDVKTPIFDDPEQQEIIGLIGIRTDITLLKNSEQQLRQLAHFDPLTKLHNRVLLSDRLNQAMSQARRHQQCLAVAYLDLDGFKAINDTHGHNAGDKLLMTVAARMKDVIREGDTLARVGGDEFVAILLDLKDTHHCKPQLSRLLQAAAKPVDMDGLELKVTASLGVTFYPQPEELEPDQLLRQADQAMYQAKLSGKNRYHLFDTEQDRDMRTHHESLEHIRHALHNGEFVLYYQPKVNMRTGQLVGAEALIRWQHPQQGLLTPAHFLPAIEEHPMAIEVGNWVIDAALQQIREWRNQGLELVVSVNLGARQLRQSDFVERLQQLLGHYPDINPAWLELEVLETSTLGDLAQISERLRRCRQLGLNISLDDFGTGYSSLTYLKQLPAGMVKVDQSFVRDILEDPEDLTILDGVISLARAFGRSVIAEGVETIQHGDMLLRIGCELAQGYGIAHPMPAADIPKWASAWKPAPHWASLAKTDRNMLPLLYAGIEQMAWIESMRSALDHPGTPWPQLSREHSRFETWYRQCSTEERAPLTRLSGLHQQLHELASRLHASHQAGQEQQASDEFQELCQLHRQLTAELERVLTPSSRSHHPAGIRPRLRTV